ncbi:MAG: cytochrome c [Verrucomicrobiales bacterium]|nr:cytochrome c [Verrucomicrobiales bacterium]
MNTQSNHTPRYVITAFSLALIAVVLNACSTLSSDEEAVATQSGAELWANNCSSCHNYRDPGAYTDAQWDVASMHMRIRANLTGPDYRAIRDFLKSSN